LKFGKLRVVRLDRDAIFLYTTSPLREADIDDLRSILAKDAPDGSRVIRLFTEQDRIHRSELLKDTVHEPFFNILQLRVRFAASIELIGSANRRRIPLIARHAKRRFTELGLRQTLPNMIEILRNSDQVFWDRILGKDFGTLRTRLASPPKERRSPRRQR